MKFIRLGYSIIVYLFFLAVFNYLVLFLGAGFLQQWVPLLAAAKTVDSGPVLFAVPGLPVWLANLTLLLAFSFHHSIFARAGVKKLLTKLIPQSAERSTFVLVTCGVLAWMFMAWQPQPAVVWSVGGWLGSALVVLFLSGAGLVLWSTFLISHWSLFGLSQAWHAFIGKPVAEDEFKTPSLYRYSRHPMYVGVLLVIWATPQMTVGHMMLALVWTLYVLVGIYFEERDLVRQFGQRYLDYQRSVSRLLPLKAVLGKRALVRAEKAKQA